MLLEPEAMTAALARIQEEAEEPKTLDLPPAPPTKVELMRIIARFKIDTSDPRESGLKLDDE
jgi:hypothetical protein